MRVFLACVITATAVLAATAEVAHACSCAPPEPRSLLAQADGAFVGRLEQRRELGNGRALLTFRVERSVKGQIGSTVDVETSASGASCGIETTVGSRIGLFLERAGNRWTGSLCWQVAADDLLAAVGPLPPPTGRGPVTLLLGSRFGPARTIALDALGRTLAYGRGAGTVLQVSVCPGGKRMAETVQRDDGAAVVAVRELPSLRPVRQRPIDPPHDTFPIGLRCETSDGRRVVVFHTRKGRPTGARLERLTGARRAVLWRGTAMGATLTEGTAFLTGGARGTRLLGIDLRTTKARVLGRIPPPFGPLVADPTAAHLAGIVSSEGSRRWLVSIRLQPFALVKRRLVEAGDVAWLDDRRFVLFGSAARGARLYTSSLDVVSTFGWTAYRSTIAGASAYGVAFDGLHRAALPAGPERVLRKLPGPVVTVLVPARS